MTLIRTQKSAAALLCVWVAMLLGGCSRLETEYGKSTGGSGKNSLNGFGALRALYQMEDWETRTISRVGPRVTKLDTIVWIPTVNTPLSSEASGWFDQWLAADGKTLVCVIYDGGTEAVYWQQAGALAEPRQRLEYRRRAARAEIRQLQEHLQQSVPESNGWFAIEKSDAAEPIGRPTGPWAANAPLPPPNRSGDDAASIPVRYRVTSFDATGDPAATAAAGPAWQWMSVDERSEVTVQTRTLLATEAGTPLVTRISSPDWGQSQVLVISSGSLLTNYGMSQPLGRMMAARVVAASGPAGEVGFLSTDWSGIDVSDALAGKPGKSGMEMLTVWPLSLVTIHAALFGLVVCLILMPIFGRPRNPQQHRQSDFADHLDAVAGLLARTGGEHYARQRVSDYMRRVRGETTGPWVTPETSPAPWHGPPNDAAPPSLAAKAPPRPDPSPAHTDSSQAPGDDR